LSACLPFWGVSLYCHAGMTPQEIAEVRPRLVAFAAEMLGGLPRKDQRAAGELYVRGLLTDGRRKSMQPMAARLGTDHQRLQQFSMSSTWDYVAVRANVARWFAAGQPVEALVVDDTGFAKDGDASPCGPAAESTQIHRFWASRYQPSRGMSVLEAMGKRRSCGRWRSGPAVLGVQDARGYDCVARLLDQDAVHGERHDLRAQLLDWRAITRSLLGLSMSQASAPTSSWAGQQQCRARVW
jgi:DDE superfamily endonuclease